LGRNPKVFNMTKFLRGSSIRFQDICRSAIWPFESEGRTHPLPEEKL
jgi:hypothetical protein